MTAQMTLSQCMGIMRLSHRLSLSGTFKGKGTEGCLAAGLLFTSQLILLLRLESRAT